MPVYDTPVTADANSLPRILAFDIPVVLYLYRTPSEPLDEAFKRVAQENVGEILVVKVDASANANVHVQYGSLTLPALITFDEGEIESQAGNIRPADVDAHVDFLTGHGPYPQETAAQQEAKAASGTAPIHVTDSSFQDDVLNSDIPVLVDFWAEWCGPCHMIAPHLEKLSAKYAGQVKIAKLNVDQNQQTAMQYRVQGIPMLLMFKGGQPVNKLVGAHPPQNIEQMIRAAL